MGKPDLRERIRFLASSEHRYETLRIVCANAPAERATIEGRVDASRRTVKRALDALGEQGYLRRGAEGYRPTPLGRFARESYRSFRESAALCERLEPVLGRIPGEAFDLEPEQLTDATVRVGTEGDPYRPLERVLELRRDADRIRELSSVVEERSVRQLRGRLEGGASIDVEFVLTADAAARAREADAYGSLHRSILDSDAVEGYVYEGSFPFVLGVFDDTVVIGANEDGLPGAMLESDAPAVREWAEETHAEYKQSASPLPGAS
jgi:predicted transcriptional regulator